jgi:hypothetical protein
VRILNRAIDLTVTATVSANCLVGGSTGIWLASQLLALGVPPATHLPTSVLGAPLPASAHPYPSLSGGYLSFSLQCPATGDYTVLTGGGWKDFTPQPINEGVWEGAWPSAEQGVARQTWHVSLGGNRTVEAVAYVVCALGLLAQPIVSLQASTPPLGLVTCPEPELLVGGGYREGFTDSASSTNTLSLSQHAWTAGSPHSLTEYSPPQASGLEPRW